MSDRDPSSWEQILEAHWITHGTLSDEAVTALQATPEGRQRYRAWLLLERAFGDASLPLEARLQAPSLPELQRGARMVIAQLAQASAPSHDTLEIWDEDLPTAGLSTDESTSAADHTADRTRPLQDSYVAQVEAVLPVPSEPVLEEPLATDATVDVMQGLWSRIVPLCVGIGSTMLVLLMLQGVPGLLPSAPQGVSPAVSRWVPSPARPQPRLPYAGAKGQEPGVAQAWLQLYFGISAKEASQPQRRGHDQMRVASGEWLYFLFEKSHDAGYVTLLSWQEGPRKEPLSALFPAPGKGAFVKASQTRWALSDGGVALRYQLSPKQSAVGFVGILTPKPLDAAQHRRLRQLSLGWKERPLTLAQRMAIAAALGISARRIDGFRVAVSAPQPAPQPRKVPR